MVLPQEELARSYSPAALSGGFMKRWAIFLILLLLGGLAFSGGGREYEGYKELTNEEGEVTGYALDILGNVKAAPYQPLVARFSEDHPNVILSSQMVNVSTGATLSWDALAAGGILPAAYIDFISRSGKAMREDYALDLSSYIKKSDINIKPEVWDQVTRNGKILGVPFNGQLDGMFINTGLLKEVGYVKPKNWTIDDYLEMCKLVQQRAPGKYGSMVFAANQSSTEWLLGWFAAFGVKFFEGGDYSRTVVRETGGEKVFAFFKQLLDEGLIPPESATLTDDDSRAMMLRGDIATAGDYIKDWGPAIDSQVEQGIIDEAFAFEMDAFPRLAGAPPTPVIFVYAAIVARATSNDDVNDILADFVLNWANVSFQTSQQANGAIPTVNGIMGSPSDKILKHGIDLMGSNGLFDIGISSKTYFKIRPLLHKEVGAVLTGSKTPTQAIADYERGINEALR
jgi:ABC-type glycerol-3-phosphate transport system substrate-binding protein